MQVREVTREVVRRAVVVVWMIGRERLAMTVKKAMMQLTRIINSRRSVPAGATAAADSARN